ncbi:Uncharacterised protein [Klebsiella pneumoniae]|uniref:Uncharacterized protein n=1 Tax=Klebsiella pneumoniae TaxID=573 RepID=A0A378P3X6_KLEPN|nr:Uncharacterised protein [Klebsiella pneumoniae]
MLPRFADIFQQGNRWLNWLEKQPEGSVRPVVIESVTKNYGVWDHPDGVHTVELFLTGLLPYKKGLLPV